MLPTKLLWVALPLLLVLAAFAVWALLLRRRRSPAAWRRTLNVWSSLLLLGYVATTAGLGIFWVANQQLPVFDWHYLFGYLTLVVLVLHLVLNFGVVWRHFTSRRSLAAPVAAVGDTGPRRGRRRMALAAFAAFGAVATLAAIGAAFRIGRQQGLASGVAVAPPGSPAGLAAVERYHALSAHTRADLLRRAPVLALTSPPPPFKRYPGAERIALPPPGTAPGDGPASAIAMASLAAVLWHTAGVTATRAGLALRASPSSGALFSTELYVVSYAVPGLPAALWHYDAGGHALERLASGAPDASALGAPDASMLAGAAACVVATAVFARTGHKYGDRGYRYVLADLGHAIENLRQAAVAAGADVHVVAAFDESRLASTLAVDERDEGVLALIALATASGAGRSAAATSPSPSPSLSPALWPPAAPPPSDADPVAAVHAATSLRAGPAVPASPAAPAIARSGRATAPGIVLPEVTPISPATAGDPRVFEIIHRRRSLRRYADTPLSQDALAGVLAAMSAQGPLLSAAVRVHLVINAVAGMAPGAYRHEGQRRSLLPSRPSADLRDVAQAAALDQDVIGGAAAVFVLTLQRAVLAADPAGAARGYRHGFIEAGLVGERIYLEAGARGLAACAVGAFYDDEAAAMLAIDPAQEWVVHFAALGVPDR